MNWIDIVAFATILLLASFGFKRGLIREVGSLLAVLLALLVAIIVVVVGSRALPRLGPIPEKFVPWIVALLAFFALLFILQVILHVIQRAIHATPLGFLDRLGGAGFGAVKGLLAIAFVFLILSLLPLPRAARTQLRGSALYSTVRSLSPTLGRLALRSVKQRIDRAGPSEEKTTPAKERI